MKRKFFLNKYRIAITFIFFFSIHLEFKSYAITSNETCRSCYDAKEICNSNPHYQEFIENLADLIECVYPIDTHSAPNCSNILNFVPQIFLGSEKIKIGIIGEAISPYQNLIVLFGSRDLYLKQPSFLMALSGEIYKTPEMDNTIINIFKKFEQNENILIIGHSQGGATAQYLAYSSIKLYFEKYGTLPKSNIDVVTFASPGIKELLKLIFQTEVDTEILAKINVINFANIGDPVTKIGTQLYPSYLLPEVNYSQSSIYSKIIKYYEKQSPLYGILRLHPLEEYIKRLKNIDICKIIPQDIKPEIIIDNPDHILIKLSRLFIPEKSKVKEIIADYQKLYENCSNLNDSNYKDCVDFIYDKQEGIIKVLLNQPPGSSYINGLSDF